MWNGVNVPVVDKYCYLGLWFQNNCSWNVHFEEVMKKVERQQNMLMPVWKSRHISVEVKRIVMLTCVRPIVEIRLKFGLQALSKNGLQLIVCKLTSSSVQCVWAMSGHVHIMLCWLNGV
jgi:hypothetical protein